MEHVNTAFLMVAGMLFAIMIMSLIAFVFSSLTVLPNEEDSKTHAVQAAAFNEEYLAYDKKIMYGTDVISVLNKALSNNEKYIRKDGLTFLGGGYNTDYIIDIQVTINADLQEEMTVMHVLQTATGVSENPYTGSQTGPYKNEGSNTMYLAKEIFKAPSSTYQSKIYPSSGWDTLKFETQTINTKVGSGTYHLLGADGTEPDPVAGFTEAQLTSDNTLKQLLSQSTVMSQTIKNRDTNTFSPLGWSQATWKPAIYDLKTRKFKCKGNETVFSEKTGRIIKMVFEEF